MSTLPAAPGGITDETMSSLAKEIAADLKPIENILDEFGFDQNDFDIIKQNQRFQTYLQNARIGWGATENVEDRVKAKAAATLEEVLPEFYARILDPREPLSSKVQAGELLRKVGSIGVGRVEGGAGEKFSLVINIGRGATPKTIEGDVVNVEDYSKPAAAE